MEEFREDKQNLLLHIKQINNMDKKQLIIIAYCIFCLSFLILYLLAVTYDYPQLEVDIQTQEIQHPYFQTIIQPISISQTETATFITANITQQMTFIFFDNITIDTTKSYKIFGEKSNPPIIQRLIQQEAD